MAKRYGLGENQWESINDFLPGRAETVGVTAQDNRLFVEAVIYRYRAGILWCDLPERFGGLEKYSSAAQSLVGKRRLGEDLLAFEPGIG